MSRPFLRATLVILVSLPLHRSPADETSAGPRNGKYIILTYGAVSSPPIFLGYVVLSSGSYKAYLPGDNLSGQGKYQYEPSTHSVSWKSGPYTGVWGGEFAVERGGKTHAIRLKRNTLATNSTDAQ